MGKFLDENGVTHLVSKLDNRYAKTDGSNAISESYWPISTLQSYHQTISYEPKPATIGLLKEALDNAMYNHKTLQYPGQIYSVPVTITNIVAHWEDDDYELLAGSRSFFMRLDQYCVPNYGIFLVGGMYARCFYRLVKGESNAGEWETPVKILDVENYANIIGTGYIDTISTSEISQIISSLQFNYLG